MSRARSSTPAKAGVEPHRLNSTSAFAGVRSVRTNRTSVPSERTRRRSARIDSHALGFKPVLHYRRSRRTAESNRGTIMRARRRRLTGQVSSGRGARHSLGRSTLSTPSRGRARQPGSLPRHLSDRGSRAGAWLERGDYWVRADVAGIAGLLAQTPAGGLIDRSRNKPRIIILAAVLVTASCVSLPFISGFRAVTLTQRRGSGVTRRSIIPGTPSRPRSPGCSPGSSGRWWCSG